MANPRPSKPKPVKSQETHTDLNVTQRVGFKDLVALFNRPSSAINMWIDGGYITRDKEGYYRLNEAVQGSHRYMRDHGFKRGGATKEAASTRVNEARARAIEQETALKAKDLISFAEHSAILDLLVGGISAEIDGLPARLTRDRVQRAAFEKHCADMKRRLLARWERMARGVEDAADAADEDGEEA